MRKGILMDTIEARRALGELEAAAPVLGARESATRATAILDRSGLKPLDLTDYLQKAGYEGAELVRTVGRMATPLTRAYEVEYGYAPLKRVEVIAGRRVHVNAYLEVDRYIFDAVFLSLFGTGA